MEGDRKGRALGKKRKVGGPDREQREGKSNQRLTDRLQQTIPRADGRIDKLPSNLAPLVRRAN